MRYIEAPQPISDEGISLFMAGGIMGCPDWQSVFRRLLPQELNLTLMNPRRRDMVLDPSLLEEQIIWEHNALVQSSAISFWFPKETLCPITLYELGKWTARDKRLFIGTHPDYQRRRDVIFQTKLERPEVTVVDSLEALARQVTDWSTRLSHLGKEA